MYPPMSVLAFTDNDIVTPFDISKKRTWSRLNKPSQIIYVYVYKYMNRERNTSGQTGLNACGTFSLPLFTIWSPDQLTAGEELT